MNRQSSIILSVMLFTFTACSMLPSSDADIDATVNARVAGTLSAVVGQPSAAPTSTPTAVPEITQAPTIEASPTPTASQPTNPPAPAGSGPNLAGCQLFPPDHILNTRVDTLPIDPRSDAYITSIGADTPLHADFGAGEWEGGPIGIPYTVAGPDVVAATISFYYPDESDPGPYAIPSDPQIEGGPDSDGDRHILILDTSACRLEEIYDAQPNSDGSWEAGSGAIWDLSGYALRPAGWTSADAAGLPILPLLVRYDEVAAGEIRHAIRFTAEETQSAFVWPARHIASDINDENVPPMGQRFRLKPSFNISPYPHDVQVILRAMQQYGIILADNGSSWFINGAPDPRWNNEEIHDAFNTIHGSDFEAVYTSGLLIDPDSGQAQQP